MTTEGAYGPWRSLGHHEVRSGPCKVCGTGYTACLSVELACCPTCADNDTHADIREKQTAQNSEQS